MTVLVSLVDRVASGVLHRDDRLRRERRCHRSNRPGWVVKTTFAAAPTAMFRPLLLRRREAGRGRRQRVGAGFVDLATRERRHAGTADFVLPVVHASVAEPGTVSANSTELPSVVTVLPPASCTLTTGWTANATPPVEPVGLGCVVKASFAAAPTVIATLFVTAEVSEPSVAVSV